MQIHREVQRRKKRKKNEKKKKREFDRGERLRVPVTVARFWKREREMRRKGSLPAQKSRETRNKKKKKKKKTRRES